MKARCEACSVCVCWRWGGERLEKKGRGKRAERGETKGLDREKIEQRDTEVKTINCSDIIEHTLSLMISMSSC